MAGDAWGGSEELWSQTALRLVAQGHSVSASVLEWRPPHPRVLNLLKHGIEVRFRPKPYPIRKRAWHKLTAQDKSLDALGLRRAITARPPGLVVFSSGGPFPPIDLLEICTATATPFVTIGHANAVWLWPPDAIADRYRVTLRSALRCYFVSNANRQLAEIQIGSELPNAEIVRNPFNVGFDTAPAWPEPGANDELRFACVGRLEPSAKGQDILLEALAGPSWATRRWRLHIYGEGPIRCGLERLAQRLGLSERVVFDGRVSVDQIWALNHALVMPSRFEGLPLAIVEAMLSGRPVIATDVAGHAEVIEDGVTGFLAAAPTVRDVSDALERFWERRSDAKNIGAAASKSIRRLVPPDPIRVFAEKIEDFLVQDEAV
jgi:glycosyltransferase involved in cell wall biosynthesis